MSEGSTHQQFDHVERLIEFKIEGNNVILRKWMSSCCQKVKM